MSEHDIEHRLASWVQAQLPGARDVHVEGLDRSEFGHSAETLLLTMAWQEADGRHRRDVVVRVRPAEPGLLPPYDLKRQFDVLRALDGTPVRAPRALWLEASGEVIDRPFYVMDRLPGTAYEERIPDEIASDGLRVRSMCEAMIEQLAAIHTVNLAATGLETLADGWRHLEREIDHWEGEIRRVQRGPLPGLERLVGEVRRRRPEQCPNVTLVHGDAKSSNFAFVGTEVTAVFDWELATIGDPLTDIGWAEALWELTGITSLPGAPTRDEFVARWEELTGIPVRHRGWYRALELLKMAVIQLVAGRLFDDGHTDDLRFANMAYGIGFVTQQALAEIGITDELETGSVLPHKERLLAVKQKLELP